MDGSGGKEWYVVLLYGLGTGGGGGGLGRGIFVEVEVFRGVLLAAGGVGGAGMKTIFVMVCTWGSVGVVVSNGMSFSLAFERAAGG